MTTVALRARAASREDLRTWRCAVLLAASMLCAACGDDEGPLVLPGNSGPTPAGSCNFMAEARCDEYSEVDATSATAGSCTSAGGAWSGGKCPFKARTGLCPAPASAASRTYSYSAEAAAALKGSCMSFIEIKSTAGRGGSTAGGAGGGAGTSGGRGGAGAGGSAAGAGAGGGGGAGGQGGGAAGDSGAGGAGGSAGASGGSGGNGGLGGAGGG